MPARRSPRGKHIVMVNVEADVLAGPLLAEEARSDGRRLFARLWRPAGADLRDWSTGRAPAASTSSPPARAPSTCRPITRDAGRRLGPLRADRRRRPSAAGMNPQMFNSFLDGTKSAIEMAAIANATGLDVPADGLAFPPCGVDDLPHVLRGRDSGRRAGPRRHGRGGLVASSATAARSSAICAGASTSSFKAPNDYAAPASSNTA